MRSLLLLALLLPLLLAENGNNKMEEMKKDVRKHHPAYQSEAPEHHFDMSSDDEYTLEMVVMVSRHGIRTPFAPPYGTVNDYTMYTDRPFPDNNTWGMTENAFANQYITPHGKQILPLMGAYYRESFTASNLIPEGSCDDIVCFIDADSVRDNQTAYYWLEGFGCVDEVPRQSSEAMQPVLSDDISNGCPLATEEQVDGLYGGDMTALTFLYSDSIEYINQVLQMPPTSDNNVCQQSNPDYDADEETCTLFQTGYNYTGVYYEGMFTSPFYYGGYFAESWMLQYCSNLTHWAFSEIPLRVLVDLYEMHIQTLWFGTNFWNAQAYGSQQMTYITASLESHMTGQSIDGLYQKPDTKFLLLVSHDTNILYLQRLLDLNWIPRGFANRVATTGGTISFELYTNKSGHYFVKIHYDAASPEQQRNAEKLTLEAPPSVADLIIPECGSLYCPFEKFKEYSLHRANSECVQQPLQNYANGSSGGPAFFWGMWTGMLITVLAGLMFAATLQGVVWMGKWWQREGNKEGLNYSQNLVIEEA
eukprot:CAMPEP_0201509532 /NCGR_PEP_ID=MMETSP0161_2-20130828/2558_1 /ASSEMBLY_ACC=CAM_ASM_000251 /TAXON_ID=180227 /ORGANISM="Neoparamoeba aestuarina, Strain SoJaBio B1-5/56/2" /LENGTH=532 /DNA_ID=CAMNT_0047904509 /DNA_START=74 /DNA_END=1672 /DNA_ORIENTATION=-